MQADPTTYTLSCLMVCPFIAITMLLLLMPNQAADMDKNLAYIIKTDEYLIYLQFIFDSFPIFLDAVLCAEENEMFQCDYFDVFRFCIDKYQ